MAIVKTNFTAPTLSGNSAELLAYLQANAADYFDEITADGSGNISCKVGATTALLIGMDGTTLRKVALANGRYIQCENDGGYTVDPKTALFVFAKKTSKGILLATQVALVGGTDSGRQTYFITKNEVGDTCIIGYIQTDWQAASTATYYCADIKNDTTIFTPLTGTSYANRSQLSKSAAVTAMTHAIFSGGHYAPHVFFTTFNQFALTECDIIINDNAYTTDGVIALGD